MSSAAVVIGTLRANNCHNIFYTEKFFYKNHLQNHTLSGDYSVIFLSKDFVPAVIEEKNALGMC